MQRQWLWEMRTLQRVRDSMLQELRKLEDKADEADGSAAARMAVLKTDMAKIAVRRGMPPQHGSWTRVSALDCLALYGV